MREYIKLWFKQSLSQTLTIGDTISGVVGTIVGIMGHYSPQWKNEVSENQWLIAIYALAATAFGRFFIFAPYELWKVQREKVNKYEELLSNMGTERPFRLEHIEFQFNTENENDHTSTTVGGDLQVERDSEDDQSHIGSDDLNETE